MLPASARCWLQGTEIAENVMPWMHRTTPPTFLELPETKTWLSWQLRKAGSLVGANAQVLGDGVQDVAVARGLLPDVQLHHGQPKALHLRQPSSRDITWTALVVTTLARQGQFLSLPQPPELPLQALLHN